MSYTLGNTSLYWIRPQATFGVFPVTSSGAFVMGQTINFNQTANIIDRPYKTGKSVDTICNKIKVSSQAQVTIDTAVTVQLWKFMQSYLQNQAVDGLVQNGGTQSSFTIMHINTALPNYVRYATGCTVTNINITGQPQNYAKATITLKGKQIIQVSTRPTVSGSYPTTATCIEPYFMTGASIEIDGSAYDLDNASITYDSELVPDTVRYGVSTTPTTNKKVKWMATGNGSKVFKGNVHQSMLNNIEDGNLCKLGMNFEAQSQGFSVNTVGYISDYTVADPESGLFITQFGITGILDGSNTSMIEVNVL